MIATETKDTLLLECEATEKTLRDVIVDIECGEPVSLGMISATLRLRRKALREAIAKAKAGDV